MKLLIVLSVLLAVSSAEILSRCQVVKAIKDSVLTKFTHYSVADWVCLADHVSQYNTMEIGHETRNGEAWASQYGIFQISSKWWCDDGKTPNSENGCGIRCTELLSNNLKPDIECAAKIVASKGMEAWNSWVENCKGKWIKYYSYFCF
ncbi:lysozyme C-1/C-2-like [Chiloscyllium plagiosum]|uniref:lysozyme C-1/C-2-like n=1 Tax=Chiloscyllium plagiosum TaxID=36176 RepID=UPI001CB83366|nr:lysozyme C-1/C-2-like [Chiloscyllium plagiosum]